MKIRLSILCFSGIMSTLLCGCSTNYLSESSSDLKVSTIGILRPDIEVGEKIEATATVSRICYMFISGPSKFAEGVNYGDSYKGHPIEDSFWGDTVAEAKAAAAYRVCVENKADLIICPRYYVIIDSYPFYKKVSAKVFGYKGVLKGVHLPKAKQPVVQSIQIVNPVKIADPIEIDKPIKVVTTQPIQISLSPVQLMQPIEVVTKEVYVDTAKAANL
jgi:hypothetical protein